jgi:KamA family protein
MPGLQHKYSETALILATSRCPMYCRHCFRKRLVGLPTAEVLKRFSGAARYIEGHPEIRNVLISGGDPLILETPVIERLLKRLSTVPHLEFIRIGSRSPVTFPERILGDSDLLGVLARYSCPDRRLYLVTQFNHPAEITEVSTRTVAKILGAGLCIINQTVLLRGVNDSGSVLADLLARLTSIGVCPYYVFQCRPVKRVKRNFQVPLEEGYRIVEDAKSRLPGPGKRFRYVMSHRTGKIEILNILKDEIYLKYHQARNPNNLGTSLKCKLTPGAGWLDDLERLTPNKNQVIAGADNPQGGRSR